MKTKVTICILTCNSMPQIVSTINSIIENTRYPHEILINDSESTDGTKKYLSWLEKTFSHIRVMHTKKEGYVKAINTALKEIKDGDILITHDDILFPRLYLKCWLYEMVRHRDLPNLGIITCLNGGGVSGQEYVNGFRWVGTWCMYLLRETIEKLGYFDENFGVGFGDDVDYTFRCMKAGLTVYTTDFAVEHHRLTDHVNDDNNEEIKKKNAEYFRKKYNIEG